MGDADEMLRHLEELTELVVAGQLSPEQFEVMKDKTIQHHSQQQQVAQQQGPPNFAEGDEVVACGLRSDRDLNGVRGWVVGHQRAPDGTLLPLVRFDTGSVRLISSWNLEPVPEPPLPDLSGVWGCWYGGLWVFRHRENRLVAIDCRSGDAHHGAVRRGAPPRRDVKSPLRSGHRPHHTAPWRGPLDDDDAEAPPQPPPRGEAWRRLLQPAPRIYLCTIDLQGCTGGYDGESIRWRSGAVWTRRHGEAAARRYEADPRLAASPAPAPRRAGGSALASR